MPLSGAARAASRMILLSVTDAKGQHRHEFARAEVLVGRREGVDLFLDDPGASRNHCLLRAQGDYVLLLDLDSANGTWIDGWRVTQAELRLGDEIRIGGTTLRIEGFPGARPVLLPAQPPLAPPPAPPTPPATGAAPDSVAGSVPGTGAPREETRPASSSEFGHEIRRLVSNAPWYGISLLVHALGLMALSFLSVAEPPPLEPAVIAATAIEQMEAEIEDSGLDAPAPTPEPAPEIELASPPTETLPAPPAVAREEDAFETFESTPVVGMGIEIPDVKIRALPIKPKDAKPGTPLQGTPAEANERAGRSLSGSLGGELGRLRGLPKDRILVIDGDFDHCQRLLPLYGIPFTQVSLADLDPRHMQRAHMLFINCQQRPSDLATRQRMAQVVAAFVHRGGWLLTSDWAIDPFVLGAFPGMVDLVSPKKSQPDTTISVLADAPGHPLLRGVMPRGIDARWWLEDTSKFFRPTSGVVQVLVHSRQMEHEYGARAVVVSFPWGAGRVLHLLGHFYQEGGNESGIVAMHRLILNFVLERYAPGAGSADAEEGISGLKAPGEPGGGR